MRVICTTSDRYLHLIPVFTYLFNKYWSAEQPVTILGYQAPKCTLPDNFTFHSLGKQGDVSEWSTDLRKYFEAMEETHFVWLMEDTFIKRVDLEKANFCYNTFPIGDAKIGRFDLTNDVQKRPHLRIGVIVEAAELTRYRLSTQPSIWCKEFMLKYLKPGLTPWQFEALDPIYDGWAIIGAVEPPIKHNEGVRKRDPHLLDLNGFSEEDVKHINTLL